MVERASNIGYINRIRANVLSVRKSCLTSLYEDLKSADCIVCGGSGRSSFSLNAAMSQIAMSQIGWRTKTVLTHDDPGFPGRDMYDAAAELERRYKKVVLLINSGSGVSDDPLMMAQDLSRYIDEKKSTKFKIGLITSDADSPIGQIAARYGYVVELKGRGKAKPSSDYSESGIMGDIFELGSLLLLSMMTEAISRNLEGDSILKLCEKELVKLASTIDACVSSENYSRIIDLLETRTNIFLGGKGTASEIVKMAGVRLFHIKSVLGDNVYMARGVNTPRPRAGDMEILVSYSGLTKPVIHWCDIFKRCKGIVLAITGNKDSILAQKSDMQIILEEETELGQPRRFYMRSAFMLSPLPIRLAERLSERGLKLPEHLISWYHSAIE
jgi:D-arabinose 5-phosphate isomerase GutQ